MHSGAPPKKATRLSRIRPFYVMEVLEKAFRMVTSGADVIHLQMGEPDFSTPDPITRAGIRALEERRTRYTQALGIPELREKIALSYPETCRPPVDRIAVTPGSSAGLQMVFACLVDPGDEVLLADPNYPCNFNFIKLYGGNPRALPADASTGYQLTAEMIRHAWTPQTRAVLIGSPSNPTGSVVSREQMGAIARTVRALGGHLIVDEIYHGLVYDADLRSALHDGDDIFVVNSFSKFFGMTGWRVGWLVAPEGLVEPLERLAQNLFIAAPTPSQFAALAAFKASTMAILEERREAFRHRRDFLYDALTELGFGIGARPAGAFYLYADIRPFADDGETLCRRLLEGAGVAITPGVDFGAHLAGRHVRFAYTTDLDRLAIGVERIAAWLRTET